VSTTLSVVLWRAPCTLTPTSPSLVFLLCVSLVRLCLSCHQHVSLSRDAW